MSEELDLHLAVKEDGSEVTIKITSPEGKRITLGELVLELEMYICELQRAREAHATRRHPPH